MQLSDFRVETQKDWELNRYEFSTIAEWKIETERFTHQKGVWALNQFDFSKTTGKLTERNLKMNNSNKTENTSEFTNHNGFESWNGKIFSTKL